MAVTYKAVLVRADDERGTCVVRRNLGRVQLVQGVAVPGYPGGQYRAQSELSGVLRGLVAAGLGSAMGIGADVAARSGIARVARLSETELRRRLDDIYQNRYNSYLSYAMSKLGNRQDAEDVVNESFARVLRANPDLDVPKLLSDTCGRP